MHALVVGAGSAGCAVAGRLAERGHTVTLVEAGPDWRSESCPDEIRRPRDNIFAWRVDGRSPSRFADPIAAAARFPGDDAQRYLRGRGMGGTSALNGLVAIRPPDDEFAHWVELGCIGWGPRDVLPAFRRLEDDLDYGPEPYHGMGGPVPVVRRGLDEWGSGDEQLAETAFAAGHAWEPDYHRPGALGVSRTASNIRWGVRVTSYDGYVQRWRESGRIRVLADSVVSHVALRDGSATGVAVRGAGGNPDAAENIIEADHVILSSGAVHTPAILQRSGIGPAPLLRSLGISMLVDLPVGEGMQDHVGFWLQTTQRDARPAANGARGNVTLRYSSGLPHSRQGDLLIVAANPATPDAHETAFGVKLAHCLSRGSSQIGSPDPIAAPGIRMNLLSDERDRLLARHAVRSAAEMLSEGGRVVRDRFGDAVDRRASDAELDGWLRRCAGDTSHLTGGCRMGDEDAVVDARLRVRGVGGLTVADLSVAPIVPRANTYLTAVMIGERAAEFVDGS